MGSDFVDRLLSQIFKKDKKENLELNPITKKLVRGERFMSDFVVWKASDRPYEIFEALTGSFEEVSKSNNIPGFHVYRTPQANGFFFDEQVGIRPEEFHYLMDWFRDVVLANGYQIYTSDVTLAEKAESVQATERHYLKPAFDKELKLPLKQLFGNVLMEYVKYGEKPAYLKIMANCYSDRNYQPPQPFEELTELLFDPSFGR